MTDNTRCEPPEHLRGVDGLTCWLKHQEGDTMLAVWRNHPFDHWERMGTDDTGLPDGWLADEDWRYLAPAASPEIVRGLVEALEGLERHVVLNGIGQPRYHSANTPAPPALEAARAALAAAKEAGL